MSWITIDVDEIASVSQLAIDAMPEVVGVRDRLRSAGQQYGLGTAAGPVAAEAAAIASGVHRVAEIVLTEVTDTLRRAIALLEGEQTAEVAFGLQGPAAALASSGAAAIGGSVVGASNQGWSLEGGSAVSDAIIGGGAVVGGSGPGWSLEGGSSVSDAIIGGGAMAGGSGPGWSLVGGSSVSDAIIGAGSVLRAPTGMGRFDALTRASILHPELRGVLNQALFADKVSIALSTLPDGWGLSIAGTSYSL